MSRRRGYISFFDRVGRRRGDTIFYASHRRFRLVPILAVTGIIAILVGIWWVLTRPDDRVADLAVTAVEGATVPSLLTPVEVGTTIPGDALVADTSCVEPLTSEWNTFQGNSARTGCVTSRTIASPQVLWTADVGIQGWLNNPVIGNERVFVGSAGTTQFEGDPQDGVYALDLATGDEVWFFEATLDVNGVAFANDIVVATGDEGKVWAIDASPTALAGRGLWEDTHAKAVFGAPLIIGDLVVTGDGDGLVTGYDLRTGRRRWHAQVSGAIRGGASSDGQTIVVAGDDREILALDLDGNELWRKVVRGRTINENTSIFAAPTIVDGTLIVTLVRDDVAPDPAIMALDLQTGVDLWIASDDAGIKEEWGNVRSSPVAIGDLLLYGEPYSRGLVAVDLDSGSTRFAIETGAFCYPHWPSPAAVGSQVLLPRHDGGVYAFDLRTGTTAWSVFMGDADARGSFPEGHDETGCGTDGWGPIDTFSVLASPAVSQDGIVVVGTLQGSIMAIADESW